MALAGLMQAAQRTGVSHTSVRKAYCKHSPNTLNWLPLCSMSGDNIFILGQHGFVVNRFQCLHIADGSRVWAVALIALVKNFGLL